MSRRESQVLMAYCMNGMTRVKKESVLTLFWVSFRDVVLWLLGKSFLSIWSKKGQEQQESVRSNFFAGWQNDGKWSRQESQLDTYSPDPWLDLCRVSRCLHFLAFVSPKWMCFSWNCLLFLVISCAKSIRLWRKRRSAMEREGKLDSMFNFDRSLLRFARTKWERHRTL